MQPVNLMLCTWSCEPFARHQRRSPLRCEARGGTGVRAARDGEEAISIWQLGHVNRPVCENENEEVS
jgi:hypothetical protein